MPTSDNGSGSTAANPSDQTLKDLVTATGVFKSTGELIAAVVALISALITMFNLLFSQPLAAGIFLALAVISGIVTWRIRQGTFRDRRATESPAIRRLQPFEEGEGDLLSSREEDMAALRTLLLGRDFRFGVLHGDPNSGKTSLVRARVIPELRDRRDRKIVPRYTSDFGDGVAALAGPLCDELRHALNLTDPAADLTAIRERLATDTEQRVLIVWDDFDALYLKLPDAAERRRAFEAVQPILDRDSQIGILAVVSTDFWPSVAADYETVFGRKLTYEHFLPRLSTGTATRTLKEFVKHDADLGFHQLSRSVCEHVAQGLEHGGSVCPAELQIVADQLRTHQRYSDSALQAAGGASGVLIGFIEEQLAASNDTEGFTRRILELLSDPAQPDVHLAQDEILARVVGGQDAGQTARVSAALDGLVDKDLVIHTHLNQYSLVHTYMADYARQALASYRPPRESLGARLRALAPQAAIGAGAVVAVIALSTFVGSWLFWGPHQTRSLQRPVSPLVWKSLVLVGPDDRSVLALAALNRLALWNLQQPATSDSNLPACASNPSVLTAQLPPDASGAPPVTGLSMLSADYSSDGKLVRALGTSLNTNRLWVMTWKVDSPCDQLPVLWGDYLSHVDDGTACAPVDMAYNESLEVVAVAYKAPSDTPDKVDCDRVATYSVTADAGPGAPLTGPPEQMHEGDGLTRYSRRTSNPPVKLAFGDEHRDLLLVLTQGENLQFIETLDTQLNPLSTAQPVRYGTASSVMVNKGHTEIVQQDRAGPFWTRPPSTWLSVNDGLWVAHWDSDVNQLRSWIGGLPQITPPVGVSADGQLIVEITSDADQYPVYEMYGQAGPVRFEPIRFT
jgi:hypothetical protein